MLDLRRVPPPPLAREGVPVYVNDKLGIALQLRLAREEQGLSQADVAATAGVSQQQIARLEHPDSSPKLESVAAVARALGLHVELVPIETAVLDAPPDLNVEVPPKLTPEGAPRRPHREMPR